MVDTSFKLINDFFHVNQGVLYCEHAEQAGGGATGLLNKGGRSNRLPGLVTKQQAVEFPQVLTSYYNGDKQVIFINLIILVVKWGLKQ